MMTLQAHFATSNPAEFLERLDGCGVSVAEGRTMIRLRPVGVSGLVVKFNSGRALSEILAGWEEEGFDEDLIGIVRL